jgi:glycosyltransferase involved in cell wall biosynthesis
MDAERRAPRVLLVGMEDAADEPGGLNGYARALGRSLRARGVPVETMVLSSAPGRVAPRDSPLLRRLWAMAVEGRARLRATDLLNTHFALYAFPALLAGRTSGEAKPHVVNFHGPWHAEMAVEAPGKRWTALLARGVESFVYRRADEAIVLSQDFARILVDDFGVLPARVHVVRPGVDLELFHPVDRQAARKRLGLEDGLAHFVAVRRLARRMGLDVLLRAWAEAPPGSARLHLVGEGPERSALERLAAALGVTGSVRFVGQVGDDELPLWYSAAEASLVPSVALEGFGLVVLESLACGTPVLASDTGGMAEVLPELDGHLLVPAGDAAAWAQALRRDVAYLPGRDACRRFAERFDWERVADRTLRVYERALSKAPRRPYRVVFVDHCARLSGGELAMLRLVRAAGNVEAHVILGEDGPLRSRLEEASVSCEVLPFSKGEVRRADLAGFATMAGGGAATATYVIRLARRLRQLRPDIVHTNSLKAGIYGCFAARLAGIPAVWHVRDVFGDDIPPAARAAVRRLIATLPAAVIANSTATAAALGADGKAVHVVPSPVDVGEPRGAEPAGPPVVGMVGRLAPWKGQHVFLDAVARLVAAHPEMRARLVGSAMFGDDVRYEEQLREQAERLGITGRVELAGFTDDVRAELAQLTVAVHASTLPEPFGQVVVEAMAAGVPVVASAAGGPAEVVTDGVDGLLVAPGDADALADALGRLLEDRNLRKALAEAGARTAQRFRPERIAAEVEAVYRSMLMRADRR